MSGVRLGLLLTLVVCACGVLICLFAGFTDAGDSFFEAYRRLDVAMAAVCGVLIVAPFLAMLGVARRQLERVTIALWGLPFGFWALFVTFEYWGEIELGSYFAAAFSTLGMACALALAVLPERAAAEPEPALAPAEPEPLPTSPESPSLPPAGWYPDPLGEHSRRLWDGQRWTPETR